MKIKLFFYLLLKVLICNSQNLVINPSFEDTVSCPYSASHIYCATPWFQPSITHSSSDLFNPCSSSNNVGIPQNFSGFQFPRTGFGYAGIYLNVDTLNIREYIEGKLLAPHIAGNLYFVSFYVSLADTSSIAISNFGAYFSVDSLVYSGYQTITNVTPQIANDVTNFLTDKIEWIEISGFFVANGGEQYITIGNFQTPSNTPFQIVSGGAYPSSYYFIDDISVYNYDSLQNLKLNKINKDFTIHPNPNTGSFKLQYQGNIYKKTWLFITDINGKLIDTKEIVSTTTTYENTSLLSGLYFYSLRQGNEEVGRGKFVVVK